MSNLLNQKHTLAKLKAELEGRRKRICQCCRRFGHLACNCRNKNEEEKGKSILQNRFEVIASRVMQCGVKKKVEIRKQETVEEGVQCFRCWRIGHYKWKCPVTKEERKGEVKKQHGQSVCKRCSREGSQRVLIGKRCRNTVEWRTCQKMHSYWS